MSFHTDYHGFNPGNLSNNLQHLAKGKRIVWSADEKMITAHASGGLLGKISMYIFTAVHGGKAGKSATGKAKIAAVKQCNQELGALAQNLDETLQGKSSFAAGSGAEVSQKYEEIGKLLASVTVLRTQALNALGNVDNEEFKQTVASFSEQVTALEKWGQELAAQQGVYESVATLNGSLDKGRYPEKLNELTVRILDLKQKQILPDAVSKETTRALQSMSWDSMSDQERLQLSALAKACGYPEGHFIALVEKKPPGIFDSLLELLPNEDSRQDMQSYGEVYRQLSGSAENFQLLRQNVAGSLRALEQTKSPTNCRNVLESLVKRSTQQPGREDPAFYRQQAGELELLKGALEGTPLNAPLCRQLEQCIQERNAQALVLELLADVGQMGGTVQQALAGVDMTPPLLGRAPEILQQLSGALRMEAGSGGLEMMARGEVLAECATALGKYQTADAPPFVMHFLQGLWCQSDALWLQGKLKLVLSPEQAGKLTGREAQELDRSNRAVIKEVVGELVGATGAKPQGEGSLLDELSAVVNDASLFLAALFGEEEQAVPQRAAPLTFEQAQQRLEDIKALGQVLMVFGNVFAEEVTALQAAYNNFSIALDAVGVIEGRFGTKAPEGALDPGHPSYALAQEMIQHAIEGKVDEWNQAISSATRLHTGLESLEKLGDEILVFGDRLIRSGVANLTEEWESKNMPQLQGAILDIRAKLIDLRWQRVMGPRSHEVTLNALKEFLQLSGEHLRIVKGANEALVRDVPQLLDKMLLGLPGKGASPLEELQSQAQFLRDVRETLDEHAPIAVFSALEPELNRREEQYQKGIAFLSQARSGWQGLEFNERLIVLEEFMEHPENYPPGMLVMLPSIVEESMMGLIERTYKTLQPDFEQLAMAGGDAALAMETVNRIGQLLSSLGPEALGVSPYAFQEMLGRINQFEKPLEILQKQVVTAVKELQALTELTAKLDQSRTREESLKAAQSLCDHLCDDCVGLALFPSLNEGIWQDSGLALQTKFKDGMQTVIDDIGSRFLAQQGQPLDPDQVAVVLQRVQLEVSVYLERLDKAQNISSQDRESLRQQGESIFAQAREWVASTHQKLLSAAQHSEEELERVGMEIAGIERELEALASPPEALNEVLSCLDQAKDAQGNLLGDALQGTPLKFPTGVSTQGEPLDLLLRDPSFERRLLLLQGDLTNVLRDVAQGAQEAEQEAQALRSVKERALEGLEGRSLGVVQQHVPPEKMGDRAYLQQAFDEAYDGWANGSKDMSSFLMGWGSAFVNRIAEGGNQTCLQKINAAREQFNDPPEKLLALAQALDMYEEQQKLGLFTRQIDQEIEKKETNAALMAGQVQIWQAKSDQTASFLKAMQLAKEFEGQLLGLKQMRDRRDELSLELQSARQDQYFTEERARHLGRTAEAFYEVAATIALANQ